MGVVVMSIPCPVNISPVGAAGLVLANTLAAKMYMSFAFRTKLADKPDAEKQKILESPSYKMASRSQLNEAEYAPILLAQFLFLSIKGIDSPWCALLGSIGGPIFMWGRTFIA